MSEIVEILANSSPEIMVAVVVCVIVIWGGKWLIKFMKERVSNLELDSKNKFMNFVNGLLISLSSNAENIVRSVQENFVKSIKEASADGKLTKDEIEMIRETTLDNMYDTLSIESQDALEKVFGNLDVFLSGVIESAFVELKTRGELDIPSSSMKLVEDDSVEKQLTTPEEL